MINKVMEKLRNTILRKRMAYRHTFQPQGVLSIAASDVLNDLRVFCRATSTPAQLGRDGRIDPMATGIAIGRLEVWLRIQQNLHLSDADLYRMMEHAASQDQ